MTSFADEFGERLAGRSVLVTGATGFLGWHTCRALVALGARVDGLSRTVTAGRLPPGVRPLRVDLSDAACVQDALGDTEYDSVVHLAGLAEGRVSRDLVAPSVRANIVAATNLLGAAAGAGPGRLVWVGTAEEYGRPGRPPASPYAASKLAGRLFLDLFVARFGLRAISLRLFLTFGPRQAAHKLVPYVITQLLAGEAPEVSSGARLCDAVYVDDAVRAILASIAAPCSVDGGSFDIGAGSGLTVAGLVGRIATVLGGRAELGALPGREDEASQPADLAPSRRALGWRPRWALDDAIRATAAWYRAELCGGRPE